MKKFPSMLIAISTLTLLAGCVTPPMGPMIPVEPGPGKSPQAFDQDDEYCRDYASDKVQGRVNAANDEAVQRGLIGTIIGAGLGAAVGNTKGAIVGGTAGAVIGSSSGAGYSQHGVQREYDMAYARCMASRGNDVPGWYEHRRDRDYDRDNERDYHDEDRGPPDRDEDYHGERD